MGVVCEFPNSAKGFKKGNMHISMLSFEKAAYTANGMYLSDAKMLLATGGFHGLERRTLAVKPRPGAIMTCFGWEADGVVVNSTYAFCLSCIAAWSVIQKRTLPQPLARLLGSIPVHFTKHDSSTTRLLQNLVDSAVQRHTNRSVQCPVYITEELNRLTSPRS